MTEPAPFKVGQRVRMKPGVRPNVRFRTGVVVRAERVETVRWGPTWYLRIRREGAASKALYHAYSDNWEAVPEIDITLDQIAQDLADAVKKGDTHAALALADRVMEMCGATPRPVAA